jgi:hypothetical protein
MGKASKELTENRNEAFIELNQDYHDYDDNSVEEGDYSLEKDFYEKVETCALQIHGEIMEYVDNEGLHMCEFLDLVNTQNYVNWVLNYR